MRLSCVRWLAVLAVWSCSGDRSPRNDTATPERSPPTGAPATRSTAWEFRAGRLFAIRSANGTAWLVNPAWAEDQDLDSLTEASWNPSGDTLEAFDGAMLAGRGRLDALHYDSTCAGWPTVSFADPVLPPWRVAFPAGRANGVSFDSLPGLSAGDSAVRVRAGALAASRLPGDTASAFRGHPFTVRQAIRFPVAPDTMALLFEVVRLVAQEANPLEEKIIMVVEEGPAGAPPRTRYAERVIALEETMPSLDVLGILRIRATGRLAILVRREREGGFLLEWIERTATGDWRVRWRSALDTC